jgi:hypothetical protein
MRGAILGLVLGLVLGAMLGARHRLRETASQASPGPCPSGESESFPAPAETLRVEQQQFERLWGTPISPPSPPDLALEQAAVETALAQQGYEWDAVDCSEFPCVALVLSTERIDRAALREELGLPHAHIRISTYTGERHLYLASIAFVDRSLSEGETRWVDTLAQRMHDRYAFDLHQLTEADP